MTHKTSHTNNDGLTRGYGPNFAERELGGVVERDGGVTEHRVYFTYESSAPTINVPAGSAVKAVYLKVGTAWVGGTNVQVGDGSDPDGYVSAAQGATANLLAGAMIVGGGAYLAANTDVTARELEKVYAAADTIDVAFTGAYTAGTATLIVELVSA